MRICASWPLLFIGLCPVDPPALRVISIPLLAGCTMEFLKIRHIVPKLRLNHKLPRYPVFTPPNTTAERNVSEYLAQENFDYFIATMDSRLENLSRWMMGFSIFLDYSSDSVISLQKWMNRYGGLLAGHGVEYQECYDNYTPIWTGKFHGLNVIYDIGTYIGNYVINKRKSVSWKMYKNIEDTLNGQERGIYYNKPTLFGPIYSVGNPLYASLFACTKASYSLFVSSPEQLEQDPIVNYVKFALYAAASGPDLDASHIDKWSDVSLE